MRFFPAFSIIYFVVLAIEIYADTIGNLQLVWITKPLLMPLLLALFLLNAKNSPSNEKWWFAGALFFSMLGDIFLMFRRENLFIFGLGSFLIAHLAYIISFLPRIKEAKLAWSEKAIYALPFVAFVLLFLNFLYPFLDAIEERKALFFPVSIYAVVISLMGYSAFLRRKSVSIGSFWMVLLGAFLFIISDSSIAINKFVAPLAFPGLVIMSTYGVAQYLITWGVLKDRK